MSENYEVWKDCKGYEGKYQVSSLGRVWSVVSQSIKTQRYDKDGYLTTTLCAKNGKMVKERVHRLVAIAFLDNPDNCPVVNHLNGIKDDNRLENLEWSTVRKNTKHAYDNNLGDMKNHQKTITEKARLANTKTYEIWKDGQKIGEGYGLEETAKMVGCDVHTITNNIYKHMKNRKGYTFRIKEGD